MDITCDCNSFILPPWLIVLTNWACKVCNSCMSVFLASGYKYSHFFKINNSTLIITKVRIHKQIGTYFIFRLQPIELGVRLADPDIRIRKKAGYPEIFGSDTGSGYPKFSVRISDPDIRKFRFGYRIRIRISESFGSDPKIRKNGKNPSLWPSKLQKIFACDAWKGRNLAPGPSKITKLLPAALKNEGNLTSEPSNFKKFPPAALKEKEL